MHGAGGIEVSGADSHSDHPVISYSRSKRMFARITSLFASGYSWEEVTVNAGRVPTLTGVSGSPSDGAPAFERRTGKTDLVPDGTIYEFTKSPASNEWVFPSHHVTPPPPPCYWCFAFVGCSGFYPLVSGVTYTLTLAGTVIASGTGSFFCVDSTALSGGPLVLSYSKVGFQSRTYTVATSVGTCPDNGFTIQVPMAVYLDPAYVCCQTVLPGAPHTSAGCPDPLPTVLPLTTTAGNLSLTYDPGLGYWWGSIPVTALVCSYDAYGNCIGMSMSGTVPLIFSFACGPLGGLGCSIDMIYNTGNPLLSICQPLPLCTPAVRNTGGLFNGCSYVSTFGALATWDPTYQCLPRYFTFPATVRSYPEPLIRPGYYIDCPNPAAGSATLG